MYWVANTLLVFYGILLVFAHQSETIRGLQYWNMYGTITLLAWKFVEAILWKVCKNGCPAKLDYVGHLLSILALAILTIISLVLFNRVSEFDFSNMRDHSGPYGIGTERFWTKELKNHVLVFYPIAKQSWLNAFHTPSKSFLPYSLFGEKAKIAIA